jgi:hypothetical protein
MSRNWWTRVDPKVAVMGDIGGDTQVSEAYGARFWHPLAAGRFAVIDRAFYIAEHDGRRVLEQQTNYVVCRDWQRPFDTEERSDARHSECEGPATEAAAYEAAEWGGAVPLGGDEWVRIYPDEVLA